MSFSFVHRLESDGHRTHSHSVPRCSRHVRPRTSAPRCSRRAKSNVYVLDGGWQFWCPSSRARGPPGSCADRPLAGRSRTTVQAHARWTAGIIMSHRVFVMPINYTLLSPLRHRNSLYVFGLSFLLSFPRTTRTHAITNVLRASPRLISRANWGVPPCVLCFPFPPSPSRLGPLVPTTN